MEKLLYEYRDFVMDEGTGMIREDDILQYIENRDKTALDLHNLIQLNKSDITAIVSDKMEQLDEGWIDTVDLFIYAKKLEFISKLLVEQIKDKVDASKFGPTGYTKYDVELVGRNSAGSWDFSNCNYPKLDQVKLEAAQASERVKEQQEFLKGLKEPLELLDSDTGEITKVFPPVKSGKLGPVATLK